MRKTAVEILRDLEIRVAHLERQAAASGRVQVSLLEQSRGRLTKIDTAFVTADTLPSKMNDYKERVSDGAVVSEWDDRFPFATSDITLDLSSGANSDYSMLIHNSGYFRSNGDHIPDHIISEIERDFGVRKPMDWRD